MGCSPALSKLPRGISIAAMRPLNKKERWVHLFLDYLYPNPPFRFSTFWYLLCTWSKIRRKQSSNIELNSNDKKKLEKIIYYIDILLPKCETETYEGGATEFIKEIEKTITQSTGIPTTSS